MNIGNNLSNGHFSPYTASTYAPLPGSGGAEGEAAAPAPMRSGGFPSGGDSLMAMHSYSGSYDYSGKGWTSKVSVETRCFRWRGVYLVSIVILGVSSVAFVLLASQPILVVIFTLGSCMSEGCDEWLEFSSEVLRASLIPLAIGMAACMIACTAYVMQRRLAR